MDKDISGSLKLDIYIWYVPSRGSDSICELTICKRNNSVSHVAMRDKVDRSKKEGVKIAWSPTLPLEFHGVCSIAQGKGGFPILQIEVANNIEVCD